MQLFEGNIPCEVKYKEIAKEICKEDTEPEKIQIPEKPPWKLKEVKLCYKGTTDNNHTDQITMKNNFLEHNDIHKNTSVVYTDGSKTATNVGYAAVFNDKTLRGRLPTLASIFTAELHAICAALREINSRQTQRWTIYTDSQSAMQEISKYNPEHPITQYIQRKLIELQEEGKNINICKVPSHVLIEGNEKADRAAKETNLIPGLHTKCIPFKDLYPSIREYRNDLWQRHWESSHHKLKIIKPKIEQWKSSYNQNRRKEVILARMRIGHTRLTHKHHMEKTNPPMCDTCIDTPMTVKHILVECNKYNQQRIENEIPNQIEDLLGKQCQIDNLFKYLLDTKLLDQL